MKSSTVKNSFQQQIAAQLHMGRLTARMREEIKSRNLPVAIIGSSGDLCLDFGDFTPQQLEEMNDIFDQLSKEFHVENFPKLS